MTTKPPVHIRNPDSLGYALCGVPWHEVERGGRVASSTCPPVIDDDERKSVNPASCVLCVRLWRESLK